jgi:hypothetical protein
MMRAIPTAPSIVEKIAKKARSLSAAPRQGLCYHLGRTLLLKEPSCDQERIDMDIQNIVAQLRQEASRLEQAIAALAGYGSQPARRGRPPKGSQSKTASSPKRRRMSAAARARIAAAKKAWWAKHKGKSGPKKSAVASKKSAARKPMGPAMRKKLSAMMKARWAARKKAA